MAAEKVIIPVNPQTPGEVRLHVIHILAAGYEYQTRGVNDGVTPQEYAQATLDQLTGLIAKAIDTGEPNEEDGYSALEQGIQAGRELYQSELSQQPRG